MELNFLLKLIVSGYLKLFSVILPNFKSIYINVSFLLPERKTRIQYSDYREKEKKI